MKKRERRQAGHGGAQVVWVARSACGEAAGSVARESGPRWKASGRWPGVGGYHMSRGGCVAWRRKADVCSMRLVISGPGTLNSKHKMARGRECKGCGHESVGLTRAGRRRASAVRTERRDEAARFGCDEGLPESDHGGPQLVDLAGCNAKRALRARDHWQRDSGQK